jgi:predicted Zn-dependent peptidase
LKRRNQKINAVTLADVKRVARDVLKADALSVTIVGKPRL